MKFLFILFLLLIASSAISNSSDHIEINDETNSFVKFTYEKAKSANLELLHQKKLSDDYKEIRIWIGFGAVTPEQLVILKINKQHIDGKKFYVFDADPERWEGDEDLLEEALEDLSFTCIALNNYKNYKSCELIKNKYYAWNKIYDELEQLNIWTLPDQSKLPKPKIIYTDGIVMMVELRDGNKYRAYYYGNPGFRNEKEDQQALKITSLISSL